MPIRLFYPSKNNFYRTQKHSLIADGFQKTKGVNNLSHSAKIIVYGKEESKIRTLLKCMIYWIGSIFNKTFEKSYRESCAMVEDNKRVYVLIITDVHSNPKESIKSAKKVERVSANEFFDSSKPLNVPYSYSLRKEPLSPFKPKVSH